VAALALVLATPAPAHAERVFFTSGRSIPVKGYRVEGNSITVTLPHGGEATFAAALIARIEPDEVPDTEGEPSSGFVATEANVRNRPFAELIDKVARRHGISPVLVHAVVEVESNYHVRARSRAGARGLMQVMPSTARDLGVSSPARLFDPRENLEAGVKYLKAMLQRFNGDLVAALAAYNAGPGAVDRYAGVPPFPETREYVRKVLSALGPVAAHAQ